MPMSFPDLTSLTNRAKQRGFRQPKPDESIVDYRAAFALFMRDVDKVESMEISSGSGWDQWSLEESEKLLREVKPEIGDLIDELAQRYPHVRLDLEDRNVEVKPLEFYGEAAEKASLILQEVLEDEDVGGGTVYHNIVKTDQCRTRMELVYPERVIEKYLKLLLQRAEDDSNALSRELALMFTQALLNKTGVNAIVIIDRQTA